MEKEKETKAQADISSYIEALTATYRPAPDAASATHWFTTGEVHRAIRNIDPATGIALEQVHDALLQAGFRYRVRPGAMGLEFRWMMQAL